MLADGSLCLAKAVGDWEVWDLRLKEGEMTHLKAHSQEKFHPGLEVRSCELKSPSLLSLPSARASLGALTGKGGRVPYLSEPALLPSHFIKSISLTFFNCL